MTTPNESVISEEVKACLNEIELHSLRSHREAALQRLLNASTARLREQLAAKQHAERNGSWMDEWGACKVCDGEIPHGHSDICDIYKRDMEYNTLRLANEELLRENSELKEVIRKNVYDCH